MNKEKYLDKKALGYGMKAIAFNDMKKTNTDFDDLDNMFLNEDQLDYGADDDGNEICNLEIL
tara:strand:+ start:734 stop:919 length:186 start_codon:yes stop_codon:yes gene_type:complete